MPTDEEIEAGVQRQAEYWGWDEVKNPDIIQPLMDVACINGHEMIHMDQIPKPFPIVPNKGRFVALPLPVPEKTKTPSGLIILENDQDKAFRASDARVLVVAVGETPEGIQMPEVGEVIVVSKAGGQPTFVKGTMYILFHGQMDFIATVTSSTELTEEEVKRSGKATTPDKNHKPSFEPEAKAPPDMILPTGKGGDA